MSMACGRPQKRGGQSHVDRDERVKNLDFLVHVING